MTQETIVITEEKIHPDAVALLKDYRLCYTGARFAQEELVALVEREQPVAILSRYGKINEHVQSASHKLNAGINDRDDQYREGTTGGLACVYISNRDSSIAYEEGKEFSRRFRETNAGTWILAGSYTKEEARRNVRKGLKDLVVFGR